MTTGSRSGGMSGTKLYQARAREALPLLVRQAEAGMPISYARLAEELGMPNPRNLNYVLGSVGQTLQELSKTWRSKIPPIQCLVINQRTGIPGEGVGWFIVKKKDFGLLSPHEKHTILQAELHHVLRYPRWREVLQSLDLQPAATDFRVAVEEAATGRRGGESAAHKALKDFVARTPEVVGLRASTPAGKTEEPLPSGDSLDVSFRGADIWVAAEVKSAVSNDADIARGMFQCVKYRAVMEAFLRTLPTKPNVRAVLVLESKLPRSLIPLRNMLGIDVVDGVSPCQR